MDGARCSTGVVKPCIPLVVCLLSSLPCHGSDPEAGITNGAMSDGEETPTGWVCSSFRDSSPLVLTRDTEVFATGPASLRVHAESAEAQGNVSQTFVAPGGTFTVAGSIKADKSLRATVQLQEKNDAGERIASHEIAAGKEDWKTFEKTITLQDQTARCVLILNVKGQGNAWLDEIVVK